MSVERNPVVSAALEIIADTRAKLQRQDSIIPKTGLEEKNPFAHRCWRHVVGISLGSRRLGEPGSKLRLRGQRPFVLAHRNKEIQIHRDWCKPNLG